MFRRHRWQASSHRDSRSALNVGSPQKLWERACSRRRCISRRKCSLTLRLRWQASSHRDSRSALNAGSPQKLWERACSRRRVSVDENVH
ncbi:hypothetical protein C0J26_26525 [Pseudomonas baetica]|nr:hypothetical protein C0J26_26525 [Pseudomonas baetica]